MFCGRGAFAPRAATLYRRARHPWRGPIRKSNLELTNLPKIRNGIFELGNVEEKKIKILDLTGQLAQENEEKTIGTDELAQKM